MGWVKLDPSANVELTARRWPRWLAIPEGRAHIYNSWEGTARNSPVSSPYFAEVPPSLSDAVQGLIGQTCTNGFMRQAGSLIPIVQVPENDQDHDAGIKVRNTSLIQYIL
jgi:hypothetical protein